MIDNYKIIWEANKALIKHGKRVNDKYFTITPEKFIEAIKTFWDGVNKLENEEFNKRYVNPLE